MLALNRNPFRSRIPVEADPAKAVSLAGEEAALAQLEAVLAKTFVELGHGASEASCQIDEACTELESFLEGDNSADAEQARASLPTRFVAAPSRSFARTRADKARKMAVEARRLAATAEKKAVAECERNIDVAEQDLARVKAMLASFHAMAVARVETDRAAAKAEVAAHAKKPLPSSPAPVPGSERRKSSRIPMQTEVDLSSDTNFYSGFSTDLSDGGLFVATCNVAEIGTEVDLAFTLPTGQRIESRGVVRWVREFNDRTPEVFPGVGIEFVDTKPSTREAIQAFMRTREPMFLS